MASYKIEIKKSAVKEIENLPSVILKRVVTHIQELANDPRPLGCKKLSGDEKYRLRVGDYRILYEIEDEIVMVYVVKVAHRKEVYRML
ncbi:type II toxin-antitoxin system RelE family toxin [Sulfuricurvum sp.]|uniref:type II toxin-antitoxin system RelE family toxin n=1 Tax=Sulfuricurvum sp. TaxID=2025608 RepID=UPI003C57DA57